MAPPPSWNRCLTTPGVDVRRVWVNELPLIFSGGTAGTGTELLAEEPPEPAAVESLWRSPSSLSRFLFLGSGISSGSHGVVAFSGIVSGGQVPGVATNSILVGVFKWISLQYSRGSPGISSFSRRAALTFDDVDMERQSNRIMYRRDMYFTVVELQVARLSHSIPWDKHGSNMRYTLGPTAMRDARSAPELAAACLLESLNIL